MLKTGRIAGTADAAREGGTNAATIGLTRARATIVEVCQHLPRGIEIVNSHGTTRSVVEKIGHRGGVSAAATTSHRVAIRAIETGVSHRGTVVGATCAAQDQYGTMTIAMEG
jgi:hypothetical protein